MTSEFRIISRDIKNREKNKKFEIFSSTMNFQCIYCRYRQIAKNDRRRYILMKNVESTKQYIREMLAKLDDSDEIFLKQLCVIIRKHLDRKHIVE